MLIVLEGPDFAGKSTLGKYLSDRLGLPLRHSGGPSKYPGEVNERADRFAKDPGPAIYDRHPVVSQNLYAMALANGAEMVTTDRELRFYESHPLIIYCRPVRDFEHIPSEHTPPGYEHSIAAHYDDLVKLYDQWANSFAHFTYRMGDDPTRILNAVKGALNGEGLNLANAISKLESFDMVQDVEDFHTKFSVDYVGPPRLLPHDLAAFRELFLDEERAEYQEHIKRCENDLDGGFGGFDNDNFTHHLADAFDSLIDLVYVALGTAHLHGFDFRRGWQRVHRANMRKMKAGEKGEGSKRGSKHDIIKPKGWTAPDHTDLVRNHAHLPRLEKVKT
jgi:predicted HAD superfamily Cof-like phosphohydrolase